MLTTVEKALALKKVELFSDVPGEALSDIAFLLNEVFFEKGAYIVSEEEIGRELYIIIKGSVDIISNATIIDSAKKGAYFGEMAIIDSQPRSADVIATQDVTLLKMDKDDFHEILKQRPEVAIGIIKVLNRRIRNLNKILRKQNKGQ